MFHETFVFGSLANASPVCALSRKRMLDSNSLQQLYLVTLRYYKTYAGFCAMLTFHPQLRYKVSVFQEQRAQNATTAVS